MSYSIFTTDSFIVKANSSKDADLNLVLFTEQFGLINAIAKSARHIKSKLRPALQSLSFSSISLVKGREVWRITSAKKYISLHDSRLPDQYHSMFARLLLFVERFCPRETVEIAIYQSLKEISGFIFKNGNNQDFSKEYILAIENLFMFKTLFELGYILLNSDTKIFATDIISKDLIIKLHENDNQLLNLIRKDIEKGILESNL